MAFWWNQNSLRTMSQDIGWRLVTRAIGFKTSVTRNCPLKPLVDMFHVVHYQLSFARAPYITLLTIWLHWFRWRLSFSLRDVNELRTVRGLLHRLVISSSRARQIRVSILGRGTEAGKYATEAGALVSYFCVTPSFRRALHLLRVS